MAPNPRLTGNQILWWCFVPILCVIIIIFVWCKWWWPCPWCRSCPTCPPAAQAKLVIEDTHTAVWAPFDNGWVDDAPDDVVCATPVATPTCTFDASTFRNGVMIQLGEAINELGNGMPHYGGVRLSFATASPVTLMPNQFDWLDVRAVGTNCPMKTVHAYSLFKHDQDADDMVSVDCDAAQLTDNSLPPSCLRERALHAAYRPNMGVISYWTGATHYSMTASPGAAGGQPDHELTYRFDLLDAVTVDQWQKGCFQRTFNDVVEIRVLFIDPDSNHGGYHDPPIDGGTIRVKDLF